MGVPEENVYELINEKADRVEMLLAVQDWLGRSLVRGKSDVYIFFAGHGLATDDGSEAFLIPYDGSPRLLQKPQSLVRNSLKMSLVRGHGQSQSF